MILPREVLVLEERLQRRLAELDDALRASVDAQAAVQLDQTTQGRLARMDAPQPAGRHGPRAAPRGGRARPDSLRADPAAPFCMDCEIEIREKDRKR